MKKFLFLIIFIIVPFNFILCQTNVSGNITEPTIWTLSGSPYTVVGYVTIQGPDGKLTIENGVEIEYSNGRIVVNSTGKLTAHAVTFLNGGISCSGELDVNNCEFQNSSDIYIDNNGNQTVTNSNFANGVLSVKQSSTATISGNTFDTGNIFIYDASPTITGNTLNTGTIWFYSSANESSPTITNNTIGSIHPFTFNLNQGESVFPTLNISGNNILTGSKIQFYDTYINGNIILPTYEGIKKYYMTGDIYVNGSATIPNGVEIEYSNGRIVVNSTGKLTAHAVTFLNGGISCSGELDVNNCEFQNSSDIYIDNNGNQTVTNSNFANGVLSVKQSSTATISGNTFDTGNIFIYDASPTITGNTLNTGTIWFYSSANESSPTITNNTIGSIHPFTFNLNQGESVFPTLNISGNNILTGSKIQFYDTYINGNIILPTYEGIKKYYMTGDIYVNGSATIPNGVEIEYSNGRIVVNSTGKLTAHAVTFLNGGISCSGELDVNNCEFQNSSDIYIDNNGNQTVTNSNFANGVLSVKQSSTATISGNTFDTGNIFIYDASPTITGNTLNTGTIWFYSSANESSPTITNNTIGSIHPFTFNLNQGESVFPTLNISGNNILTGSKIQFYDTYINGNIILPTYEGIKKYYMTGDIYVNGSATIPNGVEIEYSNGRIVVNSTGKLTAHAVTFLNGGISCSGELDVNNCEFQNSEIYITNSENSIAIINNSNFLNTNTQYGVNNISSNLVNAKNNYWNGNKGPKHSSNPEGNGCAVSDNVDFIPFASSRITITTIINKSATIEKIVDGPSIQEVYVPENGTGYIYFNFLSDKDSIYLNSSYKIWLLKSDMDSIQASCNFLDKGIFRIDINENELDTNDVVNFTMPQDFILDYTSFHLNNSPITFAAQKIPLSYTKSWSILFGGSVGASGGIGAGAGVSVSLAKLSIKGEGGLGLKYSIDNFNSTTIERHFDSGISANFEVPSFNTGIESDDIKPKILDANATTKKIFGQVFSPDGLNLDEDTKKVARAGFILESLIIGGMNTAPTGSIFLTAIKSLLKQKGNIPSMFDNSITEDYNSLGYEGQIDLGLELDLGPYEFTAFNYGGGGAISFKKSQLYHYSSLNNSKYISGYRNTLTTALNINAELFKFGFKFGDNVELTSNNFSLFDKAASSGNSYIVEYDSTNKIKDMYLKILGGTESSSEDGNKSLYYNTSIEIPSDYEGTVEETKLGFANFLLGAIVPIDLSMVTDAIKTVKLVNDNYQNKPLNITTNEIRGRKFDLSLGLNVDVGLGPELGGILGIKFNYYDEFEYTKKFTKLFADRRNYLIYSSNYDNKLDNKDLNYVLNDLFSGVYVGIKNIFLSLQNKTSQIVNANENNVINSFDKANNLIGGIIGSVNTTGKWLLTNYSPNSQRIFQKPFEKPVVKNMYYNSNVIHKVIQNNSVQLQTINNFLLMTSDALDVEFQPENSDSTLMN